MKAEKQENIVKKNIENKVCASSLEIITTMELFSRRWATGSAQKSNNYGIMTCMCYMIFWVQHITCFLLGPIQPSFTIVEIDNLTSRY